MGFPASGKCAAPIRVCRRLAKQRKESNGACKDGRGFREEEISIRPCGVADKVGRRTLSPGNRTSQHPKTHRGWQRLSLGWSGQYWKEVWKGIKMGTSLAVQWLKNLPYNARDSGLIPGQETRIPHAAKQLSLSAQTTKAHVLWHTHHN